MSVVLTSEISAVVFFLIFSVFGARANAEEPTFQTTVDVGVALMDDDVFVSTRLDQQMDVGGFSAVLSAPIRLRAADRPPSDEGVLRKQDWDTPSDFARIVPKLLFQRDFIDGYVDFYAGSLNGVTLSTGEMVNRYFNSSDMDQYKGGLSLRGGYRGNGAEVVVDNVVSPSLLIGRLYTAPLAWFIREEWAKQLEIGYSAGVDFQAPLRAYETESRTLSVMGGELSWRAVNRDTAEVRPHLMLAAMDGDLGVHAGLLLRWVFLPDKGMGLSLSGTYRYCGPDYLPSLFNPFYDFNRYHYPVVGEAEGTTLADYLSYGEQASPTHGVSVDLSFEWKDRVELGARYDRTGTDRVHWVMFFLSVSPISGYHLRGFYAGQDLAGGGELFGADSLFGVEGRGRVWGPLDLFVFFSRIRRDIPHRITTADETGGGFGAAFTY